MESQEYELFEGDKGDEVDKGDECDKGDEGDKGEKGDVRNVPKFVIKEFIEVYRAHPALWQLKNKEVYGNRNLKYKGHQALVKVWKKYDSDADIKMIKSKIQSIRGSFRKELKKVQKSLKSGSGTEDVYKPQLWYFGMLQFLSDHETPTESVDNLDLGTFESVHLPENEGQAEEMQPQIMPTSLQTTPDSVVQPPRKKSKKQSEADERTKFLSACTNALKYSEKEVTENDAFGTFVSKKFDKVKDDFQRLYAEQLITKTLNYAIMGKLTEDSYVTTDYSRTTTPEGTSHTSSSVGTLGPFRTPINENAEPTMYTSLNNFFSQYQTQEQ